MSKKRIMSWILIVFFVSGVLFSYGYIARNVEHDCTGQECPICMMYAFATGCTVPFKYKDNVNYASVPGVLKCVHTWSCIGVYPRVLYLYARFPEGGIAELI